MSHPLDERVETLPTSPGVYLFKDRKGKVIYVGKARNLRVRVRQYFAGVDERLMVRFLVQSAHDVEVVVVGTDKEAIILENTLIKKHRPRYNVKLVDDSSFLHLHVDLDADWPRFRLVRHIERRRAGSHQRFFGPFASASRGRATLEFLNRRFPLRTCSDRELRTRTRPCLLHQMGRCIAPCVDLCSREEYDEVLQLSLLFLEGRSQELLERLRAQMVTAAEQEAFEDAARLRDLSRAIEASIERQHVVDKNLGDRDVWALFREGERGVLAVLPVRQGLMQEAMNLPFQGAWDEDPDLLATFLNTWYEEGGDVPPEVVVPFLPSDDEALAEVLAERRGSTVRLLVPQRGEKARLVEMARENAEGAHARRESEAERLRQVLAEVQRACHLPRFPKRIECFDNSNIQGTDPVASMVVFIDGRPDRARYRRYRVKTVEGADDFATMREILGRRLRRGLVEGDLPDLLVVDGGKGQLNAALVVMRELGVYDQRQADRDGPVVPVIGLAKPRTERARGERDAAEKIVLPGVRDPIRLRPESAALRLLQYVRDESHETAVRYHRKVRDRRSLTSEVDDLPGVGPVRRQALLRHFGSISALKVATVDELAAVQGVGNSVAARIVAALHAGPGEE